MASCSGGSPIDTSAPPVALGLAGDFLETPPCGVVGVLGGRRGDFSTCSDGGGGGGGGGDGVPSSWDGWWGDGSTPRATSSFKRDMAAVNL